MDRNFKTTGRLLRQAALATVVVLASLAIPTAHAAPCAGFTDVQDTSAFCPSVEWIKNRNVTTGCTGTTYCPDTAVSRLAMAAFMKRLGDALTPVQLALDQAPGAVDLDGNLVVCSTTDLAVTAFPRTAYADATLSATATADVSFAADLVVSLNGGANWTPVNANANRGSAPANQWGSLSDIGARDLNVGENVRFGVRMTRGGVAGTTDLTDSRCQMRVLVYSRTGSTPPF